MTMTRAAVAVAAATAAAAALLATCSGAAAQMMEWDPFSNTRPVTVDMSFGGKVVGVYNEQLNYRLFGGIPYAEPPTGERRWAAPLPSRRWNDTFYATKFAPGCPQTCDRLPEQSCPKRTHESCLFLDVWTPPPPAAGAERNPIIFWIHGGAFTTGSGNAPLYFADFLAGARNACVVSINYRLGALGWAATADGGVPPNLGLLDQRLAMRWAQDNAAAFGCDTSRVTLVGESAGAMSIVQHLLWPTDDSEPVLFHRAVLQSAVYSLPYKRIDEAGRYASKLASQLGCRASDVACLRAAKVADIVQYQEGATPLLPKRWTDLFLAWTPTVDGNIVRDQPLLELRAGRVPRPVPLVLGANQDEGILFVYLAFGRMTYALYRTLVFALFKRSGKVMDFYPARIDGATDKRIMLSLLVRDYLIRCPKYYVADHLINAKYGAPIYAYNYNHSYAWGWGDEFDFCRNKSCHAAELPFTFASARHADGVELTPGERNLTQALTAAWSRFAHTGSPNEGPAFRNAPRWLEYGGGPDKRVFLEVTGDSQRSLRWTETPRCDFWRDYFDNLWSGLVAEQHADAMAEPLDVDVAPPLGAQR